MSFIKIIVFIFVFSVNIYAHCQIPCGIYDDKAAFAKMRQHVVTIHKSIDMINALSIEKSSEESLEKRPSHQQQFTRWVLNKENHASDLQHMVSDYFLSQRIASPGKRDRFLYKRYLEKLAASHQIIFYAMKSKQSLNLDHITELNTYIDELEELLKR